MSDKKFNDNNAKTEEKNIENKSKIEGHEEQKDDDLETENNNDNDKKIVIEENNPDQLKIDKLESDLSDSKDEKLRLLAEMENLRKRFEKEKN